MTPVDKIILGTVQFGLPYGINNTKGQIPKEEAFKILDYAKQAKIRYLDTAGVYGTAEEVLGEYFIKNNRESLGLITKFNFKNGLDCEQSLLLSMKKMRVEKIETILFHSFSDYQSNKHELDRLIERFGGSKAFDRIGVSVYTNDEIEQLISDKRVEVVQAPFNILDNEIQRGSAFKHLKEAGKQVHVRSVFLQGLFFKDINNYPEYLKPLAGPIGKLSALAASVNLSLADLAFLYPFSIPSVDGVLVGVDNLDHLKSNVGRTKHTIPKSLLQEIKDIRIDNADLLNPSKWKI